MSFPEALKSISQCLRGGFLLNRPGRLRGAFLHCCPHCYARREGCASYKKGIISVAWVMGILHCIGMGVVLGQSQIQFELQLCLTSHSFQRIRTIICHRFTQINRVNRPPEPALADADAVRFAINLTASRRPRGTRAKTTHYPVLTERII